MKIFKIFKADPIQELHNAIVDAALGETIKFDVKKDNKFLFTLEIRPNNRASKVRIYKDDLNCNYILLKDLDSKNICYIADNLLKLLKHIEECALKVKVEEHKRYLGEIKCKQKLENALKDLKDSKQDSALDVNEISKEMMT